MARTARTTERVVNRTDGRTDRRTHWQSDRGKDVGTVQETVAGRTAHRCSYTVEEIDISAPSCDSYRPPGRAGPPTTAMFGRLAGQIRRSVRLRGLLFFRIRRPVQALLARRPTDRPTDGVALTRNSEWSWRIWQRQFDQYLTNHSRLRRLLHSQ